MADLTGRDPVGARLVELEPVALLLGQRQECHPRHTTCARECFPMPIIAASAAIIDHQPVRSLDRAGAESVAAVQFRTDRGVQLFPG